MKRLAWVIVLVACAPPPAAGAAASPLPTVKSKSAPESHDEVQLVVQEQAGDRDGDGIVDAMDRCPDDPEDRDGFEDDDGCPDPDNDRDGILDVRDKCPNDPGPPPDGCPKKKP